MKPGVTPEMEAKIQKEKDQKFWELLNQLLDYKRTWFIGFVIAAIFGALIAS